MPAAGSQLSAAFARSAWATDAALAAPASGAAAIEARAAVKAAALLDALREYLDARLEPVRTGAALQLCTRTCEHSRVTHPSCA